MKTFTVGGLEIAIKQINEIDFISLTDMAKQTRNREPRFTIRSWLRNSNTLLFLEAWEEAHNPDFKRSQMDTFRISAFEDRDDITAKKFISSTGAVGIQSKAGRYGGTYAHIDIALEFATWLDARFKVAFIKDYQRLKTEEQKKFNPEWTFSRFLSKVNYPIHTDAIKTNLVPRIGKGESHVFASEADMLNVVVFGHTAKEWREANPVLAKEGNIRDHASEIELTVLSNMESLNAFLIQRGASMQARFEALYQAAISQFAVLRQGLQEKESVFFG